MPAPRRGVALASAAALTLVSAACGWSPPSPPPTSTAACGPGPSAAAVADEIALLQPAPWRETSRGHAADCHLNWVIVTSGTQPDAPQQVLFFADAKGIGSPTPDPRPYIAVNPQGDKDAVVQYQWRQGQDQPCCPTGFGTARATVEDGRLTILDPIPGPQP
jgi:hypothetical protein